MKRMWVLVFAAALALALPGVALADSFTGKSNWKVTFDQSEKMSDNFSDQKWADDIRQLQPGDDITFTVKLNHQHSKACDWYMANEVLKSLEEAYATGSAYSYKLTYKNETTKKSLTLYDSNIVGGDRTNGLLDATSALEDFFYLDNLKKDDEAHVDLRVELDGETEGNAYFDTLAQLKMKFAVELPNNNNNNNSTSSSRGTVQTGDDTNLFPFFVAMAVSGALLMILGLYGVRQRKQEREEAAR